MPFINAGWGTLAGVFCCTGSAPVAQVIAMPTASIECPHCQAVISEPEIVAGSVRCAACGNWFALTPNQLAELVRDHPPAAPSVIAAASQPAPVPQTRAGEIREKAENLVALATVFWVIGFIVLVGSVVLPLASGAPISGSLDGGLIGGGLMSAGFWLYLTGQIVHIRANTEK